MEAFLKANIIKGLTSNANYIFNFNNTAIKPVDCRQCIEIPRRKINTSPPTEVNEDTE